MKNWKWGRLPALTGVLFVALLVGGGTIANNTLDDRSGGAAVLKWYRDHQGAAEVSAGLIALLVVLGAAFYRMVRDYLAQDDNNAHLAGLGFAGAVLFAAGGSMTSGVQYALAHAANSITPDTAQALNVAYSGTHLLQDAGIALLAFATGLAILRGSRLPHWTGWLAFVAGAGALVPPLDFVAFIGIGLWTLAVSITMYLRLGAATAATPTTVPAFA